MKAKTSISLAAAHALLSQANAAILNDDEVVNLMAVPLDASHIGCGFLTISWVEAYAYDRPLNFLVKDNAKVKIDGTFMWLKAETGIRHKLRLLSTMSLLPVEAAPSVNDDLIELIGDNLSQWEDEEDSVKEEHAELIERLNAADDRLRAALAAPANPVRVIVEVSGGNVQAVYSSDESIDVSILDHDNLEVDASDEARALGHALAEETTTLSEVIAT